MRWIALRVCSIEPAAPLDSVAPLAMCPAAVQLAICAISLSFTPRVAVCGNAVALEVSGSLRLFGGLHKLADQLEQRLRVFFKQNGLVNKLIRAQAATSLIALGRLQLMSTARQIPRHVADMPMHTLSATHPHLAVLERTGCRTWGDLLALPRDGVARRFGAPLLAALDQARGALPEAYTWHTLPEHFEQKVELDALIIHAPALMAGVGVLLVQLHAWLLGRQSGLCALKLVWHLDKRKGVPVTDELEVRTAQPAQNLQHVARLITERLNQVSLQAPVHSITLLSLETVSLHDAAGATASLLIEPKQLGASSTQFIERLSARLGARSVEVWQPQADHRPEAMQRWVIASDDVNRAAIYLGAACASLDSSKGVKAIKKAVFHAPSHFGGQLGWGPTSSKTDALFPTWLLPQPLKLTSRAGAPLHQGPLVKLAGPQRLEATGWLISKEVGQKNIAPALRDYFIYRCSRGTLLWIYSERLALTSTDHVQREWYLQGVFA